MYDRGFTLIEMLLSVAIIALLAGLSLPVFQSFNTRNEVDISSQSLVSALRRAQVYAKAGYDESPWGVAVQQNNIVLYKGASYATRDAALDEITPVSPTTTITGLNDIPFAQQSGLPQTSGSITLTNVDSETRTVTINTKGMVSY